MGNGMLSIVSTGPGSVDLISAAARDAVRGADCIIGYRKYVELIAELVEGKEVFSNGMRGEIDRCRYALDAMRGGKDVALICGGDAGVFSLAGLIYELAEEEEYDRITVIPGVTAATAAAALLGAPLIHDFVVLSLSDLLTDPELIRKRVRMAIEGDYVLVLYNPKSMKRVELYDWVLREYLDRGSVTVPVGIVRNAFREGQVVNCMPLEEASRRQELVDMSTVVVIGNSATKILGDRMVTPRGYTV